jgi:hypothetical protein
MICSVKSSVAKPMTLMGKRHGNSIRLAEGVDEIEGDIMQK